MTPIDIHYRVIGGAETLTHRVTERMLRAHDPELDENLLETPSDAPDKLRSTVLDFLGIDRFASVWDSNDEGYYPDNNEVWPKAAAELLS